jgi:hypothetical protein
MYKLAHALIALAVVTSLGCGGGSSHPTAPVSGTVKLDGQPAANRSVTYQPEGGGMASVGMTDAAGYYTLKSLRGDFDGAVVAKHRVIIRTISTRVVDSSSDKNDPKAVDPIPKKYNDATELTMEVPANGRDDADFNLSSK